jgi:hypothetical protein
MKRMKKMLDAYYARKVSEIRQRDNEQATGTGGDVSILLAIIDSLTADSDCHCETCNADSPQAPALLDDAWKKSVEKWLARHAITTSASSRFALLKAAAPLLRAALSSLERQQGDKS